jgi:hypothetical protein
VVLNGIATTVDQKLIVRRIDDRVGFDFLPVVVDEDVLHDRQQPCFQICPGSKLIAVAQRTKRCFLVQVFGLFSILGQIVCKALQDAGQLIEL